MSIIKKRFGEKLKTLRKQKGFTQESLAEKIGINLRQLARIEAGESFISSDTLFNICNTFDVSPKTLFDFDLQDLKNNTSLAFNVIEKGKSISNQYKTLKNQIESINNDSQKIEYMTLAFNSLHNKESLNELKILIKGIELTQK